MCIGYNRHVFPVGFVRKMKEKIFITLFYIKQFTLAIVNLGPNCVTLERHRESFSIFISNVLVILT